MTRKWQCSAAVGSLGANVSLVRDKASRSRLPSPISLRRLAVLRRAGTPSAGTFDAPIRKRTNAAWQRELSFIATAKSAAVRVW